MAQAEKELNPTLKNLENWLTIHGVDPIISQSAALSFRLFQADYVIPLYGLWVPIGIGGKQDQKGIQVQAYMYKPDSCSCANPQEVVEQLKAGFKQSTLKFPYFELEFFPLTNQKTFEDIAKISGNDYLGELQDL